jgi:hypothetical protein
MSVWEKGDPFAKVEKFQFTQFRDIAIDTAPSYLVHELLPRIGVAIDWGKPKSGKTFSVFDLEMHIALGWLYRGRHVEGGTVLHIACEGVRGLGARKEAWRVHHTEGKSEGEIAAIDAAPFHLCKNTALDLIKDTDTVINDIAVQFPKEAIRLITIDTLNRSLRGSESKDEDMGAYISAAIALADKFQCLVLIIHHCGHNEERPRGHSSLLGSADVLLETKKDTDGLITTEVEEMRDGPNGAKIVSKLKVLEVGRDLNNNPITSCVIIEENDRTAEPAAKPKDKPPPPLAQRFYDALLNAAADLAKIRPQSHGKPSITEDQWVRQLEQVGLLAKLPLADVNKADHRKAYNARSALLAKNRAALIAANWIRCNDKFVWSIRRSATDEHG